MQRKTIYQRCLKRGLMKQVRLPQKIYVADGGLNKEPTVHIYVNYYNTTDNITNISYVVINNVTLGYEWYASTKCLLS